MNDLKKSLKLEITIRSFEKLAQSHNMPIILTNAMILIDW